jgi:hypothetical protein
MKKHAVVLTLTLLELLALALLAFFGLVMRPDLAATYGLGEGGELRAELIGNEGRALAVVYAARRRRGGAPFRVRVASATGRERT